MNLMDLFIRIGINDEASDKVSKLSSKIGHGLTTAAKVGGAGMLALGTAVAAMSKQSIALFADFEQLVGGVETLFKGSSDKVQEYAANAYKTAGMSANEYMETVTSFSASLLQSLGGDTDAAAEKANLAITDMSDNANKMGSSMESIQNAYQGFAKQNFTMLDNLKLGYGGTKEEMQRLLDDAEKLSGQKFDLSSYGDIVDAIHIVQTEMGITGTTAKEASETISGSVNSAKAAWKNLVTGMADDNADFDKLVDNFVESVGIAADNILPRVEIALNGVLLLVEELLPVIAERIPQIILDILPRLLEIGEQIVFTLVNGITSALPEIIAMGTEIILTLINSIAENPDQIVETAIMVIYTLATGLTQALPQIIVAGIKLVVALAESIITHLGDIDQAGGAIIRALINGIKSLYTGIVGIGQSIIDWIADGIASAWDSLVNWFNGLWDGLFGGRNVNVNVNASASGSVDGSHAAGLKYVPYDGYIAELHKGERVLTSGESKNYSSNRQTELPPIKIVVQSVLDGRVIGETAYEYGRNRARAVGV